jgi:hypothetical protein
MSCAITIAGLCLGASVVFAAGMAVGVGLGKAIGRNGG